VAAQQDDAASMLALYRRLLWLRRSEPALATGIYAPVMATDAVLAYERREAGRRLLIALNFTSEPQSFDSGSRPEGLLLSTCADRSQQLHAASIMLHPDEGIILAMP
jgi:alpha-glucosidase